MGLNPTASDWSVHMVSLVSGCVCGEKVARTGPKLVQPVEFFSAARRMAIGPFRFTENQLCQRTGRPPARRWSNLASGLTFSLIDMGEGGSIGHPYRVGHIWSSQHVCSWKAPGFWQWFSQYPTLSPIPNLASLVHGLRNASGSGRGGSSSFGSEQLLR